MSPGGDGREATARMVDSLVRAVLYEGYVLYPYRASSLKNAAPCLLGGLVPAHAAAADTRSFLELRVLVEASEGAKVSITARFLQLDRSSNDAWHDAEERAIEAALALDGSARVPFSFARTERVEGELVAHAASISPGLHALTVRLENHATATSADDLRTLAAAHLLVSVDAGAFVSCIDPPEALRALVDASPSIGVFPVLVGDPGARRAVLASAFALGDHPRVAPESGGDFYDGAEIDEMLTLRVRTMTASEIAEARALDPRSRAVVDRALAMSDEELARLHGAPRPPALSASRPAAALSQGTRLGKGDRVILRPTRRADVFDLALAGEPATIASVEQDAEGRVFFAVTVDRDPGRDFGEAGLPGHRFFFRVDEVEPAP